MTARTELFLATALLGLTWSCSGQLDSSNPNAGVPGSADPNDPLGNPSQGQPSTPGGPVAPGVAPPTALPISGGTSPLRRLNHRQLDNTLSDLFGIEVKVAEGISQDERPGTFISNVSAITSLLVEQHQEVAIRAAALAPIATLTNCAEAQDSACASSFISAFGRRAHRRALSAEEQLEYEGLFEEGFAAEGFERGVRLVLETMLQSPHFLYHVEIGGTPDPVTGLVPLTADELASRLSYFLTGSLPDTELMVVADAGLNTATLQEQARRLLDGPRAAAQIGAFHLQWLRADQVEELQRDQELFPDFDAAMALEMRNEVERFANGVILNGDGRLESLFTSANAYPDDKLFSVYGLEAPAGFMPGTAVAVDENERAGILTLPAFLAAASHADQSSPVRRGVLIRGGLLCLPVPPPPADVNTELPKPGDDDVPDNATGREVLEIHSSSPQCSGCHSLFDSLGLGLEGYDAIGQYRTEEQGEPVDTSGEIVSVPGIEGPFTGARELAERLATSDVMRECYARQWFDFAVGHPPTAFDEPSVASVRESFAVSQFQVRDLIVSIAMSAAFRSLPIANSEETR